MQVVPLLLSLSVNPAVAETPPPAVSTPTHVEVDWTWEQPRRYLVHAAMNLPYVLLFPYSNVGYPYLGVLDLQMLVTCAPPFTERRRYVVRCATDAVSTRSLPFGSHHEPVLVMAGISSAAKLGSG